MSLTFNDLSTQPDAKRIPKGTSLFFKYLKWHLSSLHTSVLKMQFLYTKRGWNVSKGLSFGTLVNRAIDKIKIFLLLMKRGKKAITWIVQWIRPTGSHLLPPRAGVQVRCAAPHQMVLFLIPCPQDATVLDHQVPCMNCVTLSCFKERGFSLCHISQRQNSMFVPSCQSWSVWHIWEQFKFHIIIKLLEKSQSWKQSRKSY